MGEADGRVDGVADGRAGCVGWAVRLGNGIAVCVGVGEDVGEMVGVGEELGAVIPPPTPPPPPPLEVPPELV